MTDAEVKRERFLGEAVIVLQEVKKGIRDAEKFIEKRSE